MKDGLLAKNKSELVGDETFTPPLSDASSLIQRVRSRRPDLVFFLPTVISDAKLILEKMNDIIVRIPVILVGIVIADPDVLNPVIPQLHNGVMSAVADRVPKRQEALIQRMNAAYPATCKRQNNN